MNTLVNFQSAQPSKTGQFSFDINTVARIERWTPAQVRRFDASRWQERWGLSQWVAKEQRFLLGAGCVVQRVPQFLIGLAALPLVLSGDWQTAASVATFAPQG